MIKCMRSAFRFRARQITKAFYQWKYSKPTKLEQNKQQTVVLKQREYEEVSMTLDKSNQ